MDHAVTDDWLSDFALVRRADARIANGNVCIVLSAAWSPAGKFQLSGKFTARSEHCIFLNCPDRSWYLNGVPGLGTSLAGVATRLRPMIDQLLSPEGQLILVGGSMGGYGATALGGHLRADAVFATGVEFLLGLNGGHSKTLNPGGQADFDIFSVMRNGKTRYILGCGAECRTDLFCLSKAKQALDAQVFPFVMGNIRHSLPPILDVQYGYGHIVDSIFEGNMSPVRGNSTALLDHPELCAALQRINDLRAGAEPDPRELLSLLRQYTRSPLPLIRGHAFYGLGGALSLIGSRRVALRALEMAARDLPENFILLEGWAQLALAVGRPDLALKIARRALALPRPVGRPTVAASFELLFEALIQTGDLEGAWQILSQNELPGIEALVATLRERWQVARALQNGASDCGADQNWPEDGKA